MRRNALASLPVDLKLGLTSFNEIPAMVNIAANVSRQGRSDLAGLYLTMEDFDFVKIIGGDMLGFNAVQVSSFKELA